WTASTVGMATMDALPVAARAYLERIEDLCGVPIDIVSTGPERRQTIVRRHPLA
ncbi:MAG TPA: adenylosuccinate synthase, partial [Candidatus Accumulibacter sp.]|nr:adenylosuccinate synthase [Accumulibacter sp.]